MHEAHALGHEVIRSARPNDLTPHAATKELNKFQNQVARVLTLELKIVMCNLCALNILFLLLQTSNHQEPIKILPWRLLSCPLLGNSRNII